MKKEKKKRIRWDKQMCAEEAKKFSTRSQFQKGCQSAYQKAFWEGWLDEICSHMVRPIKPKDYWTKEKCAEFALQFNGREELHRANPAVYNKANQKGWLDEICAHMELKKGKRMTNNGKGGYWNKTRCKKEALKYRSRVEFSKANPSAYNAASIHGWLDEICNHMQTLRKPFESWTLEECKEEAMKYKKSREFELGSPSAYRMAVREGWLAEVAPHMRHRRPKWTEEECIRYAVSFYNLAEFKRVGVSAYRAAKRNGWLEKINEIFDKRNNCTLMIELKELEKWLVDYITDSIHNLRCDEIENFNEWAQSFKKDEAEFVVGMEFGVDWGDEKRTHIPLSEAEKYAGALIQKILNVWYL